MHMFVTVCKERYKIMRNKLPIDPMLDDDKEYYNQRVQSI